MSHSPFHEDVLFREGMENGSANLLKAMRLAHGKGAIIGKALGIVYGGKYLIWRYGDGGMKPDPESETSRIQRQRVLMKLEERDRIAALRYVDRDPCPMCGVRRDIGCSHGTTA